MSGQLNHISRREFVKLVIGFIGTLVSAVIGLPAVGYLISPALRRQPDKNAPIPLGQLDKFPIGIPTAFSFTRTQVNGWEKTAIVMGMYVLRKADGQVRVFSDICTHLGCRVRWHPEIQEYVSPCHDGHFAIEGEVTKGPPPRPLDEFQTSIEDGILYVIPPVFRRTV